MSVRLMNTSMSPASLQTTMMTLMKSGMMTTLPVASVGKNPATTVRIATAVTIVANATLGKSANLRKGDAWQTLTLSQSS